MRKEIEERFYLEVAEVLKSETFYRKFPYHHKTRWNNREAGNGRYAGRGLVRMFGSNLIHVSLFNPPTNRTFNSPEACLEFLKTLT